MAARSMSSGTVSFGLVSIPVKLFPATEPSAAVSFNLMHKKCGSRLKQQYYCTTDGEQVSRDEMIKGYQFAKGQYVLFTPDELKALEEKSTQAIEITEFVPLEKVDPVFFSKPYYLGPDKGGDRAYKLLSRAMGDVGLCALAKYAARGKQYLVMLRPWHGGLVMQQLHYPDEIRSFDEIPKGDAEVNENEIKLAMQVIDQIRSEAFKPDQYEDEVRSRVMEEIQRKVDGQEITAEPTEAPRAQIIDLMDALKQSLQRGKSDRKPAKRAPAQPKAAKKKKVAKR